MAKLKLTEQQQAAVENRGGSLLVSAAAGSGKTKVLVERLFRYVTEDHCHIDDFLIITYTKAAAAELRSKIAAELSKRMAETPEDRHLRSQLLRVYQADIKTVDAFCTALLRENTHLLAQEGERYTLTPDFRVLDENDAKLLRQRVLTRVLERFYEELDEGGALLADTLGAGRDDSALEDLVLETYEKLQSHADPEHWLAENRTIWENRSGDFDETPYAAELLAVIRRKGFHHMEALRQAGQSTVGGDLYKGYGEKFLRASHSFAPLAAAQNWEAARISLDGLEFLRLTTPKGMTEDPEVLTYPAVDHEPLQLGGVGDDASAAADRQVTTPGDVHVAPQMPAPIDGTLRQFALRVPSVIDECSGIMVFGKRIKSLVFSTDLCIIRNVNADAVFAVYPFTPQPVITQALLMASDLPVFVGVGGGLTTGKRVVNLAMYAEMQGATGVVVNAPTPGRILNRIRSSVDVPVVVTVANSDTNYRHRIEDGAAILNVAAGAQTPEIVAEIRERFPDYPIIATGGADEDSIRATIRAGANAIIWTPPTNGELFRDVMKNYREGKPHP